MSRLIIEMPGIKENLSFMDTAILGFLQSLQLKGHKQIHFAVHEAIINSIQQIERRFPDGEATALIIEIDVNDTRVLAQVTDWMGGIKSDALNKVKALKAGVSPQSESGRGLLMIEQLVDEMSWECMENNQFVIRMEKLI